MKARQLLEGCGAAVLVLLAYLWPQLSPAHAAIYLSVLPTTRIPAGILLDLLALSFFFALLLAVLSRWDSENKSIVWAGIAALVAAGAVGAIGKLSETSRHLPKPGLLAGGSVLAALVIYLLRPVFYRKGVAAFRIALGIIGFSIFWMAPQLLFEALQHQTPDTVSFRRAVSENHREDPRSGPKRILWLLFDELSYANTFESVDPSVSLPNFHRLQEESVSFSKLNPPGYYTALVVPSLIVGHQIEDLRSTLGGQARVKLSGSPAWQKLEARETIFADAQSAGWTTGIAGWSNPYCRLFAPVLDYCFWLPDQFTPAYMYSHMSQQKSIVQNAIAPISSAIHRMRHELSPDSIPMDYHVRDATLLLAPAERLIADEDINLAFVHLAVPHPPGIYDRRTQRIQNGGSYLDNLALADRYLGQLLNAIELTRSQQATAVIVCSDHSWRIPIWQGSSSWTREDEQAAKKGYDPRPVLLVHFPGQKQGVTISQSMKSLVLHSILREMISGNIRDELQLEHWITAQR